MIRQLEIENFKSIERTSIDFGEFNVLIGKNGSGKTTVISAINLLKKIASGVGLNNAISNTLKRTALFNCNSNSNIAKFCALVQTSKKITYKYEFRIGLGNIGNGLTARYYFIDESLCKLSIDGEEKVIFTRAHEDETTIGVENGARIPQKINPSVSALSSYNHPDVNEVANTISSYSVIWLDEQKSSASDFIVESNNINLNTIDGVAVNLYLNDREAFNKAIAVISKIIPDFKAPRIASIDSLFEEEGIESASEYEQKTNASYVVNWSDSTYTERRWSGRSSISGGNSRIIYLILSLFNCKNESCFIAEEIENGIHFSRVTKMVETLRMIGKNRKIQLIFSTHNHLILDKVLPYEVFYVRLSENGSTYTKLSETEEYAEIKEMLGREPSSDDIVKSGALFE